MAFELAKDEILYGTGTSTVRTDCKMMWRANIDMQVNWSGSTIKLKNVEAIFYSSNKARGRLSGNRPFRKVKAAALRASRCDNVASLWSDALKRTCAGTSGLIMFATIGYSAKIKQERSKTTKHVKGDPMKKKKSGGGREQFYIIRVNMKSFRKEVKEIPNVGERIWTEIHDRIVAFGVDLERYEDSSTAISTTRHVTEDDPWKVLEIRPPNEIGMKQCDRPSVKAALKEKRLQRLRTKTSKNK